MNSAIDGAPGDLEFAGELPEDLAAQAIPEDGGAIESDRKPPDALPVELRAAHAGAHSLDDQGVFQLSDRTDDDNDGPAQRTGVVNLLPERHELDART